jgi:predicted transcriptional regulator
VTRTETIHAIRSNLDKLSDDQLLAIADIAAAYVRAIAPEDEATKASIAEGLAQANRGEFASEEEVARAFARFRS